METGGFWEIIKSAMRRGIAYFLQGLLYIIPIATVIFVLRWAFLSLLDLVSFADNTFVQILVLIALSVVIAVIGYAGSSIIFRPLVGWLQKGLGRAPLLKTIYTAVRDLLSAFVGKKKSFSEPVLVKMTESSDLEKVGFVTQKDLSRLGIADDKVAVYLPHSFAFSGNLFIVPTKNIKKLDANAADVMKFIVSGGAAAVDEEEEKEPEKPSNDNSGNFLDRMFSRIDHRD